MRNVCAVNSTSSGGEVIVITNLVDVRLTCAFSWGRKALDVEFSISQLLAGACVQTNIANSGFCAVASIETVPQRLKLEKTL
jgi:hypothetical protein